MKKIKNLSLIMALSLAFVGCSSDSGENVSNEEVKKDNISSNNESSEDKALSFNEGVYEGEAEGYNGPLKLEVEFDSEKIADIKVKESTETDKVGTPAFDIVIEDIINANGSGVDIVSGATVTSNSIKQAVNDAAEKAEVSDMKTFKKNTVNHEPEEKIQEEMDVVVVGGGGAGMMAAVESAMAGNKVAIIEKNAELGGNTLVAGGQYQSAMPYLVWEINDPDKTTGTYNGKTFDKVKTDAGRLHTLEVISNWSEEEFDETIDKDHEFNAGDIEELSKRGVHKEYLPLLKDLKKEVNAYLDWAKKKMDEGANETDLTLFSTTNLHIFQSYYGGLRPNQDNSEWIYGDYELVKQMVEEGQEIKPWLNKMGSEFDDSKQNTLIGGLWQRQNQWIGANIDGELEESRWATYFEAPKREFEKLNEDNKIFLRTSAESLIEEDGKIVGVNALRYDGTEVELRANKGVILATGGYAANTEKVLETNDYWKDEYLKGRLGTTNRNSLQGDGIEMAQEVGAGLKGEEFTQLMPLGWIQGGNLAFGGGEDVIYISPKTGKRYVDESAERDVLSLAAFENGMEYEDTKGVFIEISNKETGIPGPYPYGDEDVEMRQYVRDLDGAVKLFKDLDLDIDKETLEETIKEYDSYVMGKTDSLDVNKESYRALIGNAKENEDGSYDEGSYEIGELRIRFLAPSTHHTMGGLDVDKGRHVLNEDGEIIDGLYAAGEVTGNIHGGNRLGGNAILEVIASGRVAAQEIEKDN